MIFSIFILVCCSLISVGINILAAIRLREFREKLKSIKCYNVSFEYCNNIGKLDIDVKSSEGINFDNLIKLINLTKKGKEKNV